LLRQYATSRKVWLSIPDEVIELFAVYLILPAALVFTQSLIETSTRNISEE
jgi:hypothetical protein